MMKKLNVFMLNNDKYKKVTDISHYRILYRLTYRCQKIQHGIVVVNETICILTMTFRFTAI